MRRCWLPALVLLGCQAEVEHPPPIADCGATDSCGSNPPPITGGPGGMPGSAGAAGAGGASAGSAATALQGNVVELVDDGFRDVVPFAGPAIVEAESPSGGLVSAMWTPARPFELAPLRAADPLWVSVRAANSLALLRTLSPVAPGTGLATLGLVRADTIDFVFQLLSIPAERLPGRAHVVLRVTPRPGALEGVAGVSVASPDAASISYAAQGAWSETEAGTDATGLVVLGNLQAPAFPGRTRAATLRGAVNGSVDVRIAADAVTVLDVAATDFSP